MALRKSSKEAGPVRAPRSNQSKNRTEWDVYYSPGLQGQMRPLMELPDEAILDLYGLELAEDWNTFDGVVISDEALAQLTEVLYGRKGYFVQRSHARVGESGKPGIDKEWANASHEKAGRQLNEIEAILAGTLEAADITAEQRRAKVQSIIDSIQEKLSNDTAREKELRRLKEFREAVGKVAVRWEVVD